MSTHEALVPAVVEPPLDRQRLFVRYFVGILIDLVVLNLFAEYSPKVVVEAVRAVATQGLTFGIPNPFEVEMAELICDWVPSIE